MDKFYCKLFGTPQIYKNDTEMYFPYSKINALIYYIVINKFASRDELANLLWPEENDKIAKKNLRNALYHSKKLLGNDFILSPKKSTLVLNKNINIRIDVDLFLKSPTENINLYVGDFLQGFYLKNSSDYEFWISKSRNFYQEIFVKTCYELVEFKIKNKDFDNVLNLLNNLTKIDEFNENNFRLLMKFYAETGRNDKVISTYQTLSNLLRNELGVAPDEKTKKIYNDSLSKINLNIKKQDVVKENFFYNRLDELSIIENEINNFKNNLSFKSLILQGEAGIGKTYLIEKILENQTKDFKILQSLSYQAEKLYSLRSFTPIINQIENILKENNIDAPNLWNSTVSKLLPKFDSLFTNDLLEERELIKFDLLIQVIMETLKELSNKYKFIMVFDDIQWMDKYSIDLLMSLILHSNNILFILSLRDRYNENVDNFITNLEVHKKTKLLNLKRFNFEESKNFIKQALNHKDMSEDSLKKIYNETEGNSLFLSEYVNLIKSNNKTNILTTKMIDAIKSRFLYISKNERSLLDIVSFFYYEAPLNIISKLRDQNENELIAILNELENKGILIESEYENKISIKFSHTKLREYIYMKIPTSKKKLIHNRIGNILEESIDTKKKMPYLLSKLIFHFENGGDIIKTLKYKIAILNYYLSFSNELFPILNIIDSNNSNLYLSKNEILNSFTKSENSLNEIKKIFNSPELDIMEIEFYYIKGRYLIRNGKYKEALKNINYIINKAQSINNDDYVLEGYKQLIFYCIQTNNAKEMPEYIELALNLAVKCNYHKEIGIILRLKGLYNLMIGNYNLSEKLFNESINIFTITDEVKNKYSINIAAAYNYISEIKFATCDYKEALLHLEKAISFTKNKNIFSSLSIFYLNMGKIFFALNKIEKSNEYLLKSFNLYEQFDFLWKKTVLSCYLVLVNIKLNNYQEALKYFLIALKNAKTLKDPRDLGTLYFIEYMIKNLISKDKKLNEIFNKLINEPLSYYKELALKYLDKYRDAFEINLINSKINT